jgi:fluoride exporter
MNLVVLAALGGALGSSALYLVNLGAGRLLGMGFPWGTLIVNVVGCFIMGVLIGLDAHRLMITNEARVFMMTGHPRRLHDLLRLLGRFHVARRA